MKKMCWLVLFCVLFSSCRFTPNASIDRLMKAPMLTQQQEELRDVLSQTLDMNKVVYKYPQNGEHRSPFVFYDLDKDGTEEAIVFYGESTRGLAAKVLKQQDNQWRVLYDIRAAGTQVDFVAFSDNLSGSENCVVIGWSTENPLAEKNMTVYTVQNDFFRLVLKTNYSNYYINKDPNNTDTLLVVKQNKGLLALCHYTTKASGLKVASQLPLYEETTAVPQITVGSIGNNLNAIYVDEEMGGIDISYGTEIFVLQSGKLRTIVGSDNGSPAQNADKKWDLFQQTFRKQNVFSVDLDKNGTVMVPRTKDVGVDTQMNAENMDIVEYLTFNGMQFSVTHVVALNQHAGYLIFLPSRWVDKVVVVKDHKTQEWTFYKLDTTITQENTELLRIRVYYASEYVNNFAKDDILFGTKGFFSYYGHIPQTTGEPMAITAEEAEKMFVFL